MKKVTIRQNLEKLIIEDIRNLSDYEFGEFMEDVYEENATHWAVSKAIEKFSNISEHCEKIADKVLEDQDEKKSSQFSKLWLNAFYDEIANVMSMTTYEEEINE